MRQGGLFARYRDQIKGYALRSTLAHGKLQLQRYIPLCNTRPDKV